MKKKQVWCLVLSLLMLIGITACDTTKQETVTVDNNVIDQTTDSTEKEQEDEVVEDAVENEAEDEVLSELELPLCQQKEELTVWTYYSNSYVEDPNELIGVQAMEEATNIHINWITMDSSELAEKYGLMLASGDYPDIMYPAGLADYPGGGIKGVEDGVYLELTNIVPKYMPNYYSLLKSGDGRRKDALTDDGQIVAVYGYCATDDEVLDNYIRQFSGLCINKNLLDATGLEVPETVEEWYEVLKAWKAMGVEVPLMTGSTGYSYSAAFMTAFGVLPGFYQVDGQVKFGPVEEGYREWLTLFHQWFEEGLIDPNFTSTNADVYAPMEYVVMNRVGAFAHMYPYTQDGLYEIGATTDENFMIIPVENPVMNKGDKPVANSIWGTYGGNAIYIAADTEKPELAAMWLDYQYTKEGMMYNWYGVEGETYYYDESGEVQLTELITAHPEGYSAIDAITLYSRGNGLGLFNLDCERKTQNYSGEGSDKYYIAVEMWDNQDYSNRFPSSAITMTDEEANKYNTTYTAIQTLVNEMTVKFIMGAEDLSKYDQFVEDLYTYGLEECIQINQAALYRYNNR